MVLQNEWQMHFEIHFDSTLLYEHTDWNTVQTSERLFFVCNLAYLVN